MGGCTSAKPVNKSNQNPPGNLDNTIPTGKNQKPDYTLPADNSHRHDKINNQGIN